MTIGLFRLYSLDDGSLVVVCGKCGYHLILTNELVNSARRNTVLNINEEVKT